MSSASAASPTLSGAPNASRGFGFAASPTATGRPLATTASSQARERVPLRQLGGIRAASDGHPPALARLGHEVGGGLHVW